LERVGDEPTCTLKTKKVKAMNTELFVELSDDQQEIISGGIGLYDYLGTYFSQEALAFSATAASGPGGSAVNQTVLAVDIETSAFKGFEIYV